MNFEIIKESKCIAIGSAEQIREQLEVLLGEKINYFVMLQEEQEDNTVDFFLHSDNYEDLEEADLEQLFQLGITYDNSKEEICKYLDIELRETPLLSNGEFFIPSENF